MPETPEPTEIATAPDEVLEARWTVAIVHLLAGASLDVAAEKAGVSRRTLFDWRQDPAFRAAFEREAKTIARQARAKLQGATELAVDALVGVVARWTGAHSKHGTSAVEDKDGIAAAKALLAFAIGERHVVEDGTVGDVRGTFDALPPDELRDLVDELRAKRGGAPLVIDVDDD